MRPALRPFLLMAALAGPLAGQSLTVTHLVGPTGGPGSADGTRSAARFNSPFGVAVDGSGNVFVSDSGNHTLRRISSTGVVTTFAGTAGVPGDLDGGPTAVRFRDPRGAAVDANFAIYLTEGANHAIRKVSRTGVTSTLSGQKGAPGSNDGLGTIAHFRNPSAIAVDTAGNSYVADTLNHTIRKVAPNGATSTLAGQAGQKGFADGSGSIARFRNPSGIDVDASGNVFVADTGNGAIRKITPAGVVTTLVPPNGPLIDPTGVTVDGSGTLYVTDTSNHAIRKITPIGAVSTIAGLLGNPGIADGSGSTARFRFPTGITSDGGGALYVTDQNHTVRRVTTTGAVTTIAGAAAPSGSSDGTGDAARFFAPRGAAYDAAGNLYVADTGNNVIRKVSPDGTTSRLAGSAGASGSDDGTETAARFNGPRAVAVDGSGNVWVADTDNHVIRRITPAGVVTTLAGSALLRGATDATGAEARFDAPSAIAIGRDGAAYVADRNNHRIRRVTAAGVVTTVAGSVEGSADGTGPAAQLSKPAGIGVDGAGNLWVADTGNLTIRRVTPAGAVSTIAGLAGEAGIQDGTGGAARFRGPEALAVDPRGDLYVADTAASTIRRVTPAGVVTTVAGLPDLIGSEDGTGSAARFYQPAGIAIDAAGHVAITDQLNNAIRQAAVAPEAVAEYFVPVVLVASGAGGSLFSSEITLTNRSAAAAVVSLDYTASAGGGSGSLPDVLTLEPGRQTTIADVIAFLRAKGLGLAESGTRLGTMRVTMRGIPAEDAAVTLRTATPVPGPPEPAIGRAGLAYAGVPQSRLLTTSATLCGLRRNASDRSNIAVQNAGRASGGDVTLRITVFSGDTGETVSTEEVTLGPGEFRQTALPGTADLQAFARVERIAGAAPFYAYGVVNDNPTSDGSFVAPVAAESVGGSGGVTLPVVVEASVFSTEVVLTNVSTTARTLQLVYYSEVINGGSATLQLSLPAGQQRIIPGFVQFLRASGAAGVGPAGPSFVGPLVVSGANGDNSGIVVTARTSNPSPTGSGALGLFYAGVPFGSSFKTIAFLSGLRQDEENRSNLAIVNTGENDPLGLSVEIEVFDGATGAKAGERTVDVGFRRLVQINRVLSELTAGTASGWARLTKISGANSFLTYAVINDGKEAGARTGDGAFVAGEGP